jgi:hypothetical protein
VDVDLIGDDNAGIKHSITFYTKYEFTKFLTAKKGLYAYTLNLGVIPYLSTWT